MVFLVVSNALVKIVGPVLDITSGVQSGERQCQGSCKQECDDSAWLSKATSEV